MTSLSRDGQKGHIKNVKNNLRRVANGKTTEKLRENVLKYLFKGTYGSHTIFHVGDVLLLVALYHSKIDLMCMELKKNTNDLKVTQK